MAGMRTQNGAATVEFGSAAAGIVGRTTIHVEAIANPATVKVRGAGSAGTYQNAKVLSSTDPAAVAAANIAAAGVYYVEGDVEVAITFGAGVTQYSVTQTSSG